MFVAISSKFTHPRGSSVGSKVMQFVLYKANKHPKDKEKICFSRFVECFMVVCRLFNEKSLLFSNGSKWTDEWFKYYHYQICNSFEFGIFFLFFDLDSFEHFKNHTKYLLHLTKCWSANADNFLSAKFKMENVITENYVPETKKQIQRRCLCENLNRKTKSN